MISPAFLIDLAFVSVLVAMGLGLNSWFRRKERVKKLNKGETDDA